MNLHNFKVILRFFVFIAGSSAFAYHGKVQISDKWGSEGPLFEKNFGFVFCGNDESARQARVGVIDWKKDTIGNFCKFKHQGKDDSWGSGWRRSRLFRTCQAELSLFANKTFVCWDFRESPEVAQAQASYEGKRKSWFEAWSPHYLNTIKAILEKVFPEYHAAKTRYEHLVTDLAKHNEIRDLQTEEARKAQWYFQKWLDEALLVKKTIESITPLLEKIGVALRNDSLDLRRLAAWSATSISSLDSGEDPTTVLQSYSRLRLTCTFKVCESSRSQRLLRQLRDRFVIANTITARFVKISKSLLPARFAEATKVLVEIATGYQRLVEGNNFTFSPDADQIDATAKVCNFYSRLPATIVTRGFASEIRTSSNDLLTLSQSIRGAVLRLQNESFVRTQIDLWRKDLVLKRDKALWSLQEGKVAESILNLDSAIGFARGLIDDLQVAHNNSVAATNLDQSTLNYSDFLTETEQTKASLEQSRNELSLGGMNLLIGQRLAALDYEIDSISGSNFVHELSKTTWSEDILDQVYASLQIKRGSPLYNPGFATVPEVIEFDARLDSAFSTIEDFRNQMRELAL